MKKRGFTLVELLAVIAILAILVIIALPNVMGMFNNAKKNTFLTEIKKIYRGAEQAYVKDSFDTSGTKVYSKCSSGCTNELDMSIRDDLEYYIEVNSQGKIIKYYVKDNSFQFSHDGEMSITDIKDAQDISSLSESEKIVISSGVISSNPVSFETDSWNTIVSAVMDGNTSAYHVGDTKQINLGSLGVHTVRIANMSNPSECEEEGFSQTACGFIIEFTDIISNNKMFITENNFNTNGWPASPTRTYLNNELYNSLPSDLKGNITSTYVVSGFGSDDTANFVTSDKIYLLSAKELWGTESTTNRVDADTAEDETRQLDYYKNSGVTTSNYSLARKKHDGDYETWLLRTPCRGDNDGWYAVQNNGNWDIIGGGEYYGVSPAFRIGRMMFG